MDNYFTSDNPIMISGKFEKFTASVIKGSIKNGFDCPENVFFDLCDDFEKIYNTLLLIFNKYLLDKKMLDSLC